MNLYQKRLKKAQIFASFLSIVPFIRMVALTGSLAKGEAKPNSDIDFFIVTKDGRIWTCRFLLIFLLKLLGQYRTEKNQSGKICPNRYQTEDSLEIFPQNFYHAQEYSKVIPLFETEDVFQNYIKANSWMIKKFKIQNAKIKMKIQNSKLKGNFMPNLFRQIGERLLGGRLGDLLEEKLKDYQKKRILWDKRTYKEKARIIISDQILCFHPEGR